MFLNLKEENYRVERKFTINSHNFDEIVYHIKASKGNFAKIYQERIINNIYFDDYFDTSFRTAIEGDNQRFKTRLRWYGKDEFTSNYFLEYKFKKNFQNQKFIYKINSNNLHLKNNIKQEIFNSLKIEKDLLLCNLYFLIPKVVNTYTRNYFFSESLNLRITLDKNIKYLNYSSYKQSTKKKYWINSLNQFILEAKYQNSNISDKIKDTLNDFPYRLTKNSKYVEAIELTSYLGY